MAFVYALTDPENWQVRYIGTSTNPATRLRTHISEALVDTSYRAGQPFILRAKATGKKSPWIASLYQRGLLPAVSCLMECPPAEKFFWEAFWGEIFACDNLLNAQLFHRHRRK